MAYNFNCRSLVLRKNPFAQFNRTWVWLNVKSLSARSDSWQTEITQKSHKNCKMGIQKQEKLHRPWLKQTNNCLDLRLTPVLQFYMVNNYGK